MFLAFVIVTALTVVAVVGNVVGDFVRREATLANSTRVDVPASWLPWLATLKAAGALGLVVGSVGVPLLGLAAAFGLVLYFVGAVAAHVRAGVYDNIAFPGGYLALTTAALVLTVAR